MVDGSEVVTWSARKLQPVVLLWVALVFLALIVVAVFVFRSMTGAMALFLGAIGYLVPLVPMTLSQLEYRLTQQKIEKRKRSEEKPNEFIDVVEVDRLSHIVPIRYGFKFYKPMGEENRLRRFWKLHFSDEYSGVVHVERTDVSRVLDALAQQGVSVR